MTKRPPRVARDLPFPRDLRGAGPKRALATGDGELWRADVMELLGKLPDGSVDLVVTDPPYAIAKAEWDEFESIEAYVEWCDGWLAEIARVLAPGGHLILSVPHLSLLHEVPHDYFRFTRYGLEALLAGAGLRVLELSECGGLVSFLAHGASLALMTTLGSLPGLRAPVWALNYALLVRAADLADRWLGLERLYPCNYVVLARREGAAPA